MGDVKKQQRPFILFCSEIKLGPKLDDPARNERLEVVTTGLSWKAQDRQTILVPEFSATSGEGGVSPGRKLLFSELLLKLDPQSCSWDRCPSMSDTFLHKRRERGKKKNKQTQLWHGACSLHEPSGRI